MEVPTLVVWLVGVAILYLFFALYKASFAAILYKQRKLEDGTVRDAFDLDF
ncbi:uncharacterized protein PSFLO_07003 [Pseudozyma flocculosa]|uniref:Uncharacterized protein n=1 Tax=Pseudozyma flocculosa TaxID=84751 RepID=A0A5C3FDI3_9BASI|nr:uncharacterized protein PSFLO_07003 [Pseudozyma flocculosa]